MSVISCTLLADDDDTTNYLTYDLFQPMAVTNTLLTPVTFFHSSLRSIDLENAWHGSNTISRRIRKKRWRRRWRKPIGKSKYQL